jgi:hypothetical protein
MQTADRTCFVSLRCGRAIVLPSYKPTRRTWFDFDGQMNMQAQIGFWETFTGSADVLPLTLAYRAHG